MIRDNAQTTSSKTAKIIAEKDNKRVIYDALKASMLRDGPGAVADFLENNKQFTAKVANENTLDDIGEELDAKDPKTKQAAQTSLLTILKKVIGKTPLSQLDIQGINAQLKSAEDIQAELDKNKAKKAKVRQHKKEAWKSTLIKAPLHVIKGGVSLTKHWGAAAAHATIIPVVHRYYALTTELGMSRLQSNLLGATMLASATALSFTPILPGELAAEAYASDVMQDTMLEACKRSPMALDHPLIAAFLVGAYDSNNPAQRVLFRSAVTSMEHQANGPAMFAIADTETDKGRDVQNEGSGAEGIYQALLKTTIQWLTDYHDRIVYAGNEGAKEDIQALIDFRKKHGAKKIMELAADHNLTADLHSAINFGLRPEIQTQLKSFEAIETTPEMRLSHYLEHGPASIKEAKEEQYHIQLLGPYGGPFLLHLAENHPNTDMTNKGQVNQKLEEFRAKYKEKTGKNFPKFNAGKFYNDRLHDSNAPIFRHLTIFSAQNYSQAVRDFGQNRSVDTLIEKIERALSKAPTAEGICSSTPQAVAEAIPDTISPVQLAYMNTPYTLRANIKTAADWSVSTTTAAFAITMNSGEKIEEALTSIQAIFSSSNDNAESPQIKTVPLPRKNPRHPSNEGRPPATSMEELIHAVS